MKLRAQRLLPMMLGQTIPLLSEMPTSARAPEALPSRIRRMMKGTPKYQTANRNDDVTLASASSALFCGAEYRTPHAETVAAGAARRRPRRDQRPGGSFANSQRHTSGDISP